MSRKKVDCIWLGLLIFSFFVLAVSFLLMPLGDTVFVNGISIYALIGGIMFWASIVLGIVAQCVLSCRRSAWYRALNKSKKQKTKQNIGVFSFFQNAYASVVDVAAIISLLGGIAAMIITEGTGYICYIFVSLFVFSFSMHCVLNGKVAFYVMNQDKMGKAVEKTQERKKGKCGK